MAVDRVRAILVRLGEEKLVSFLGADLVDTLDVLGMQSIGPRRLADLLLDTQGPGILLIRKDIRSAVFNSLPRQEAAQLAKILGKTGETPWSDLSSASLRKGSGNYQAFMNWLALDGWDLDQEEQLEQHPKVLPTKPDYPLFPHQIDAVFRINSLLADPGGRAILHMPTGSGKTRSAMNVIADYLRSQPTGGRSVVWLAHSEELCEQAASEFQNAWARLGNREVNLVRHFGSYSGGKLVETDDSFVVLSLQSAHAMAFSASNDQSLFALGRSSGLVVIDEAHKATAQTYQHVLELLAPRGACRLLGLTATPGRSWLDVGEDELLADFFDRRKVTLQVPGYDTPIDYLTAEGYLAKVTTEAINYDGGDLTDAEIEQLEEIGVVSKSALRRIETDIARNLRILLSAEREAKAGNLIILFACSVDHAQKLTALLKAREISAECVTGSTPADQRAGSIDRFKNGQLSVLCNYGVLTTGFDAPKANVAIIARPTHSLVLYSQMVGRVIRGVRANGTDDCKVITVVDQKYGFRNLGEAFTFWDDLWGEH
ncbi:DEAD/DEAH box helicase [Falsiruegeria mediterranea]|uniref:DEAD/DEAH box helicase n=1 Tax=Falsiruegeria mediterranea TaxID=1280832 RepID=UPI0015F277DE|nr:DEAD/DEAH box helicase [Falsiruegeria mediterranea]